jgi:hypothetical protein
MKSSVGKLRCGLSLWRLINCETAVIPKVMSMFVYTEEASAENNWAPLGMCSCFSAAMTVYESFFVRLYKW